MTVRGLSLEERFWSKVDKSGACWMWTATRNERGYGKFWLEGRLQAAHRVSYEISIGPIREGKEIDHVCHVTGCVKPGHLRQVSSKENSENLDGAYSNSKSGVRGVYWSKKASKWVGAVRHNNERVHLGYFEVLAEAETAVKAKRLELFTHNDADRKAA